MPTNMQIQTIYASVSLSWLSDFTHEDAKFRIKPKIIPVAVTKGCLKASILSSNCLTICCKDSNCVFNF